MIYILCMYYLLAISYYQWKLHWRFMKCRLYSFHDKTSHCWFRCYQASYSLRSAHFRSNHCTTFLLPSLFSLTSITFLMQIKNLSSYFYQLSPPSMKSTKPQNPLSSFIQFSPMRIFFFKHRFLLYMLLVDVITTNLI